MTIELYVSGYGFSRRRCESIVSWFNNKYLKRFKVELEVLHRGLRREEAVGWCSVQDCDWRPRSFLIEIQSNLNFDDYVKVMSHELYHCYQHVQGDLRDKRGIRCWKGIDCSHLDYSEQPWELDAYKMEEELYQEYIEFLST